MTALPLQDKISMSLAGSAASDDLMVQFGDGYEQAAPNGINTVKDQFTLQWNALDQSDYLMLKAFHREQGSSGVFTWAAPGEATKKWSIIKDSVRWQYVGGLWQFGFGIRERKIP